MMAGLNLETLAERAASIERHLERVAARLPDNPAELQPETDASDAVVLHLWQAVQIAIDVALSVSVALGFGSPQSYASAFRTLGREGIIQHDLAERLAKAAGFRNLIVHAYADLDLQRVHAIAQAGPDDLRAFLAAIRDHLNAQANQEDQQDDGHGSG